MSEKFHSFKNFYILIEDINQKYKPFYKEYNSKQPTLNLKSKPLQCPFTTKIYAKSTKQSKNGYCEICYVKYDNYNNHIIEEEHREYARNDRHYKEIDDLIDELESEEECLEIERPISPLYKVNKRISMESYEIFDITKESINTIMFSKLSDKNINSSMFEDVNDFLNENFSEN